MNLVIETEIIPSCGVNLNAFDKIFVNIFVIFSLSKYRSINSFSERIFRVISFDSANDSKDNAAPFTNDTIFPFDASSFNFPASSLERSKQLVY